MFNGIIHRNCHETMRTKRNSHWRWDTSVEISGLFTEKKETKKNKKLKLGYLISLRVILLATALPLQSVYWPTHWSSKGSKVQIKQIHTKSTRATSSELGEEPCIGGQGADTRTCSPRPSPSSLGQGPRRCRPWIELGRDLGEFHIEKGQTARPHHRC